MPVAFTATVERVSMQAGVRRIANVLARVRRPRKVKAFNRQARLSVEGGVAWLSGSAEHDDLFLAYKLNSKASGEGAVLLDFPGILKGTAGAENIVFEAANGSVQVTAGTNRAVVPAKWDSAEYEEPKTQELCVLPLPLLKDLIEHVAFCVPAKPAKHVSQSILIESTGDAVRAVACDGVGLAIYEPQCPAAVCSFFIPKCALPSLLELDGLVLRISASETHLFFSCEDSMLMTRRDEPQFPNWRRVLPKATRTEFVVEQAELLDAVNFVADEDRAVVVFSGGGQTLNLEGAALQCNHDDGTVVRESCTTEVVIAATGEPIDFSLPGEWLKEFLKKTTGKIVVRATGPNAVVDFRAGAAFRYLATPTNPANRT